MNRFLAFFGAVALAGAYVAATQPSDTPKGWVLDWEENFNGPQLDSLSWVKCCRCTNADWCRHMSDADSLFVLRDGLLVLRGVANPDRELDPSPYLTAGVETRGKVSFDPGRFEIRARLEGAKGAWPAIWLLPSDTVVEWPYGGEIDIMERLNNNNVAWQTVHSDYTVNRGRTANPLSTKTSPINRDDFNVYGVEVHPDSVVFMINGEVTHVYPKLYPEEEGQYPFYAPMYLLLDMQLGGTWVGEVDPADLPVEMEIDWVRHYLPE